MRSSTAPCYVHKLFSHTRREKKTRLSQKKDDKFGAVEIVQEVSSHLEAVFLSNNSIKADTVP